MKKIFSTIAIFLLTGNYLVAQGQYHDTQGQLEVTKTGNAIFNIPIAMPASINNFAPAINLSYTSGQYGGIAGQGWSINGLSSIARTSQRFDIDSVIESVSLDNNDRLSLDGQRLLLVTGNGPYFSANSQYITELQSNIKVKQFNTGNSIYFEVTSPDGLRTWYGNYGGSIATDKSQYYIVRQEDKDGNFCTFHYGIEPVFGKSLVIKEIKFSANIHTNPIPLNSIAFIYKSASRIETAYLGGLKIEKSELLDKIIVKTNNLQFKKYELTYIKDQHLGYERVQKVQEFNTNNEGANPIEFVYDATTVPSNRLYQTTNRSLNNSEALDDVKLSGDFDGDGNLDFLSNNKMYLGVFNQNGNTPVYNLPFSVIEHGKKTLVINTFENDNKVKQKNSILRWFIDNNKIKVAVYDCNNQSVVLSYEKVLNVDTSTVQSIISNETGTTPGLVCLNWLNQNINSYNTPPIIGVKIGNFRGDGTPVMLLSIKSNKQQSGT